MRWRLYLLILFCVILPVPLQAAGTDASPDWRFDPERERFRYSDTIIVSEKAPSDTHSLKDIPAFITVLDVHPDAPRFHTLPEVLGSAVGVTIRDFGGLGRLSTVSIRGSSANQVLVLMDGVRINTSSGGGGVNLSDISLSDVCRIEVLRGADSAVFGNGAMGGVVNLITRKDDNASRLSLNASYGSFSTTRLNTHFSKPVSSGYLRLYMTFLKSDGDFPFLNDNGTSLNPEDDFKDVRLNNDVTSTGAGMWWRFPDKTPWRMTASTDFYYADKGMPGIVTFPSAHATERLRRLSSMFHAVHGTPEDNTGEFSIDMTGKWDGTDFDDPFGEQIGVPLHTRQDDINFRTTLCWRRNTVLGNVSIQMFGDQEYLRDDDLGNPKRGGWASSVKLDSSIARDTFHITGILRYDDYAHQRGRLSPKLGCRWALTSRLSVKANIGAGFRMPSFTELYTHKGFITGNTDLKPEKSLSFDLGFTWEQRRFRIELSAFQMNTDDLIQYLLIAGFRFKPFNIGKARSRGVELETACEVLPHVRMSVAYTYLDAEDRSDDKTYFGKTIPGRMKHTVFSRLEWTPGPLRLFVEWRYLSGNYLTRANTKLLPDRRTGNAGAAVDLGHGFELGAEIKNFSDDRVVDVRGFPLPPRSYFLSLSFRR